MCKTVSFAGIIGWNVLQETWSSEERIIKLVIQMPKHEAFPDVLLGSLMLVQGGLTYFLFKERNFYIYTSVVTFISNFTSSCLR